MRRFQYPLLLAIGIGVLLIMTQAVQRNTPSILTNDLILMPELVPPPGFYMRNISVRMQPSHPRGTIIFTLDGSLPSATQGMEYTQPIRLDSEFENVVTIRAVEIVGDLASPIVTASYVLGLKDDLPVIVLSSEPHTLWDAQSGLLANPARRGLAWERRGEFTMLKPDTPYENAQPVGIRIIGNPLYSQDKVDFRIYFRTAYGNARLDFDPFRDDDSQFNINTYKRLSLQSSREDNSVTLVRDQLVTDILSSLGIPTAQSRIVHLIINGDSWGLYRLTEHIDNVYMADFFNYDVVDIVQEGNAREGTADEWDLLMAWLNDNNLTDAVVFKELELKVDFTNFITTSCIQKYFHLPADAFYAVHPQDEKWFWVYEGNGTVPIQNSDFEYLYTHLSKNVIFRKRYATQCNDLLNSALSSSTLAKAYLQYSNMISPFFLYERAKWPNTPPWEIIASQQYNELLLKETRVRAEIADEMRMTGYSNINIQMTPRKSGQIYINGVKTSCVETIDTCQTTQFNNTDLYLQAVSNPGFTFVHWQSATPDGTFDIEESKSFTLNVTSNFSITAHFNPIDRDQIRSSADDLQPDDVHINEYWINDNGTRYASIGYRAIEGDWVELMVEKPGSSDLRGWRVTDNDSIGGTDEGSIILPSIDTLASLSRGTVILLITTESRSNDENFPADDLIPTDKQLVFYVGNGILDTTTDPGFDISTRNDSIALLAPGTQFTFSDDIVIDFIAEGLHTTAFQFGALNNDVTFDHPFSRLGTDDGVILAVRGSNDQGEDWIVDPDSCLSGDALCQNARNIVTPGRINPAQSILW